MAFGILEALVFVVFGTGLAFIIWQMLAKPMKIETVANLVK